MDTFPPSPAATYERACRLANIEIWTVALQHRRLQTQETEDTDFLFRRWADFQFLVVALTRCRRAAELAAKAPPVKAAIRLALKVFDDDLPMLKDMRDIAEHFDDYALDRGRRRHVKRQSLEVGSFDEKTFRWLGFELNADKALAAAQRLFSALKAAGVSAAWG